MFNDGFIKLIKIKNNTINYIFNKDFTIADVILESLDINTGFILHFKYIKEFYCDLTLLINENGIPNNLITIDELLNTFLLGNIICDEYDTNFIISQHQFIRLISSGYYSNFDLQAYNLTDDTSSYSITDPAYPDLKIHCNTNLSKKIAIAGNSMLYTVWKNNDAIVKNNKDVFLKQKKLSFFNLNYADDVILFDLNQITINGKVYIPLLYREGYEFIVCINGSPIFSNDIIKRFGNEIKIKWDILNKITKNNKETQTSLKEKSNSFVCFIKCEEIYYRTIDLLQDTFSLYRFNTNINDDKIVSSYFCYDFSQYELFDTTILDEKYYTPFSTSTKTYNVYIEKDKKETSIPRNFKLLQMIIKK